jgi:hypothetical protein
MSDILNKILATKARRSRRRQERTEPLEARARSRRMDAADA